MKKLLRILMLAVTTLIGTSVFGQFSKMEVKQATDLAWDKSVKKVTVFLDSSTATSHGFENGGNNVAIRIIDNHIELNDASGKIFYITYQKIKGMLYLPEKAEFQFFMEK